MLSFETIYLHQVLFTAIDWDNMRDMKLTFNTLWAYSADNKLMTFFLFFPENRFWHFMQIGSNGDNLHEMSKPFFMGKIREVFLCVVCWKFYPVC